MIKIENISIYNFKNALKGMRNPLNSWNKSDSYYDKNNNYVIGEKDMQLALRLIKAGRDHSKFMRQIFISMDITAPLYWWKQIDQYKVWTVTNSTSTMHKMGDKQLTYDDFSWNKFFEANLENIADEYIHSLIEKHRQNTLDYLNELIGLWQERKDKKIWLAIIQDNPSSFNQMRTWTGNYAVLRNIYHARKNHKLQEWKEFCKTIKELPYSELITIK